MEFEPSSERSGRFRRVAAGIVDFLNDTKKQLSTADLSPHEGRLRASLMPEQFMNIPDLPPAIDTEPK